jgi:hypothetical protein
MEEVLFDIEFKDALNRLPEKEKDKLIVRFLRKDKKLAKRMHFELVSTDSPEERRAIVKQRIHVMTLKFAKEFHSPGYLHADLRFLSGDINDHVHTTKDKVGDIELQLYLVSEILTHAHDDLLLARHGHTQKLYVYLISKVYKTLMLLNKLHEDLRYDFKEQVEELGILIGQNDSMMRYCINNGLDVNWLTQWEIPSDLDQRYKELRKMGFL